jgi:hypothetical protein
MKRLLVALRGFGFVLAGVSFGFGAHAATFTGPTGPYLQASDSPFSGVSFQYFHLEDLEDGALDTP